MRVLVCAKTFRVKKIPARRAIDRECTARVIEAENVLRVYLAYLASLHPPPIFAHSRVDNAFRFLQTLLAAVASGGDPGLSK